MKIKGENFELGFEKKVKSKSGGSYAIMRHSKLNNFGSIAGSLKHCFREIKTPNADEKQTKNNVHIYAKSTEEAIGRIKARLDTLEKKPRKDAVRCVEYVMTASPEWFKAATEAEKQQFFDNSLQYLKDTYGEENIVVATVHQDETTPHLSAYVVPITKDGRLCAKNFLGGRQKLRDAQTKFADMQAGLGLQRGVEGSRATHTTIKEYYSTLDVAKTLEALPEPEKGFLKKETAQAYRERVAEHLTKAASAVFTAEQRAERAESTYSHLANQAEAKAEAKIEAASVKFVNDYNVLKTHLENEYDKKKETLEQEKANIEQEKRNIEQEKANIEQEKRNIEQQKTNSTARDEAIKKAEADLEKTIKSRVFRETLVLQTKLGEAVQAKEEAVQDRTEIRGFYRELKKEKQVLDDKVKTLEEALDNEKNINRIKTEHISELEVNLSNRNNEIEELKAEAEATSERMEAVKAEARAEAQAQLADFEAFRMQVVQMSADNIEQNKKLKDVMDATHKLDDDYQAIEAGLQAFVEGARDVPVSETMKYIQTGTKALIKDINERLPRMIEELERSITW